MLKTHPQKAILYWLFTGGFFMSLMILIGGITRLTDSGLSMTDWNLISGTIPPLNETAWESCFLEYKKFPEYQKVNQGMTLSEFKFIFFWEYLHRLIGRVIGMIFVIPFLFFYWNRYFPKKTLSKMILIFFLGAFQAFLGWWMVKSGLVDRPDVSHYRLAIHLISAFILISYTFWVFLDIYYIDKPKSNSKLYRYSCYVLVILLIQIFYGAFVAGLKAGLLCPDFPVMCHLSNLLNGNWLGELNSDMPEHLVKLNVQNLHRILAYLLYFIVFVLFFKSKKWSISQLHRKLITSLFFLINSQFLLGVLTLTNHVPLILGVLHQLGALAILLNVIYVLYVSKLKKPAF